MTPTYCKFSNNFAAHEEGFVKDATSTSVWVRGPTRTVLANLHLQGTCSAERVRSGCAVTLRRLWFPNHVYACSNVSVSRDGMAWTRWSPRNFKSYWSLARVTMQALWCNPCATAPAYVTAPATAYLENQEREGTTTQC